MKKIFSIALASLMLFASCDLDINENPNYPSSSNVSTDLIFPAAENFVADCIGDQLFNYAGFFTQYFEQAPAANQYNDLAELNLDESSDLFYRSYIALYAGALADIDEIMSRSDNEADIYAATVLRAFTFQVLVDNLNDVPYSEALKGTANTMPKFDKGQDVYEGVLAEMDEAEAKLEPSSIMTLTDPLLNKSVAQWKGFANALRLRMLLRLIDGGINKDANIAKVKQLVAEGNFFTGEVDWDVYQNKEGQFNPWYDGFFALGTKNHCAAHPIMSYMQLTSDPRIAYSFLPRKEDNTFYAQFPGAKINQAGWEGLTAATYNGDKVSLLNYENFVDAPVCFYAQSELQFLIAEVELRFNSNDAAAKAAYEAGVQSDFSYRGVGDATGFLSSANTKWAGSNADKLNLIYMQKWVALLMRDHMESWTEVRRTDVPKTSAKTGEEIFNDPSVYTAGDLIVPFVNHKGNGGLAMRVSYPAEVRTRNQNMPEVQPISSKIFWDVK